MERTERPKLRDLPRQERYEMYLRIEYQHALDDFILVTGMDEKMRESIRNMHTWKNMYTDFLIRILDEHSGDHRLQTLSELKEQIEGCGIDCEVTQGQFGSIAQLMVEYDCVKFSVGGVGFTMVHDRAMHFLTMEGNIHHADKRHLRMPADVIVDCIRQSIPFIPRIRELAEEAERQAPAAAMVRRIRRITRMNASVQDSSPTQV